MTVLENIEDACSAEILEIEKSTNTTATTAVTSGQHSKVSVYIDNNGDDSAAITPRNKKNQHQSSPLATRDQSQQEQNEHLTGNVSNHANSPILSSLSKSSIHELTSPNAMAEAALAAGVEDRKRRDDQFSSNTIDVTTIHDTDDSSENSTYSIDSSYPSKRQKRNNQNDLYGSDLIGNKALRNIKSNQVQDSLNKVWDTLSQQNENSEDDINDDGIEIDTQDEQELPTVTTTTPKSSSSKNPNAPSSVHPKFRSAMDKTKTLLQEQFQYIWEYGLRAVDALDALSREYRQLTQIHEDQTREVERLKTSEAESRSSLLNLLQAVGSSKSDDRDASRAIQTEARLRKELQMVKTERDNAISECTQAQQKATSSQEEVELWKGKVDRLTQEKVKVERDSRNVLSLARSMDSHAAADTDFYKRKITKLNEHLQAKTTLVSELELQLDEYKRQAERSTSQNRIARIQAEVPSQRRRTKKVFRS